MTLDPGNTVDDEAVLAPGRDYIEAWLDGDVDRMAGCLHADLVKRAVDADSGSGVYTMSREEMVTATASGRGKLLERPYDITVLDRFGDIASICVRSSAYVDYLHVARFGNRWLIVNVLWQPRSAT